MTWQRMKIKTKLIRNKSVEIRVMNVQLPCTQIERMN